MPQHLIEIYAPKDGNILAGERYVSIGMPVDSTKEQMEAASAAAKSAVSQMLGRFGVHPELEILYLPNELTGEEMTAVEKGLVDGTVAQISHEELMGGFEN